MEQVIDHLINRLDPDVLGTLVAVIVTAFLMLVLTRWQHFANFILRLLKREVSNGHVTPAMFKLMCAKNDSEHEALKERLTQELSKIEEDIKELQKSMVEQSTKLAALDAHMKNLLGMMDKLASGKHVL